MSKNSQKSTEKSTDKRPNDPLTTGIPEKIQELRMFCPEICADCPYTDDCADN